MKNLNAKMWDKIYTTMYYLINEQTGYCGVYDQVWDGVYHHLCDQVWSEVVLHVEAQILN